MTLLAALIGFATSLYIAFEGLMVLGLAACKGADAARLRFAGVLLGSMSFLLAASVIKSLQVTDWNTLGMFAAILAMRTGVRAVLTKEQQLLRR